MMADSNFHWHVVAVAAVVAVAVVDEAVAVADLLAASELAVGSPFSELTATMSSWVVVLIVVVMEMALILKP